MKNAYDCKFCDTTFKLERNYVKHKCEKMKRHECIDTKKSRKAFFFYQEWMRFKHRIPPTKTTFINSRYYNAFFKYVSFSKQYGIANPIKYVKLMVSLNIEPFMWTTLDVYRYYLDNFDKNTSPVEQAGITVDTLLQLSRIFDCEIKEAIPELEANDIIKLIQAKKLSPWILLFSKEFYKFLECNASREEKILIETLVNAGKWKKIFMSKPSDVAKMKNIVKELGI